MCRGRFKGTVRADGLCRLCDSALHICILRVFACDYSVAESLWLVCVDVWRGSAFLQFVCAGFGERHPGVIQRAASTSSVQRPLEGPSVGGVPASVGRAARPFAAADSDGRLCLATCAPPVRRRALPAVEGPPAASARQRADPLLVRRRRRRVSASSPSRLNSPPGLQTLRQCRQLIAGAAATPPLPARRPRAHIS